MMFLKRWMEQTLKDDEQRRLLHNIGCALLTVLYVKTVLAIATFLSTNQYLTSATTRKFIHIMASCWILFWPLFDDDDDGRCWHWRLNVVVPLAMSFRLFYKGYILRDPNDPDVRSMSRSTSPSDLLYGPLQFTLVMTWLGLFHFRDKEGAVLVMAALGFGDGLAPIIGSKFGRHKYRICGLCPVKSMEGSLGGAFGGTILGYYLFSWGLGLGLGFGVVSFLSLSPPGVMVYATIATVLEGLSPSNTDNIIIPLGIMLFRKFFS